MHISSISSSQLHWLFRPLFWLQRRRFGVELQPATVWARVPPLYYALLGFNRAVDRRRSAVPPGLRSLIQVYVSQLNHCDFCVDLNAAIAADRLGTTDKVMAVSKWEDHTLFDEREKACLAYARCITDSNRDVDLALIANIRSHFDENGLIELTALICFQNMSSKFNAALDIEAQGLCQIPIVSDGRKD